MEICTQTCCAAPGDAPGPGAGRQDDLGLELVTTQCGSGSCPTVYRTKRGTFVVQGYAVDPRMSGITVPDGETLVEIPADVLTAALQAIR